VLFNVVMAQDSGMALIPEKIGSAVVHAVDCATLYPINIGF
jgi:hypothetical protein